MALTPRQAFHTDLSINDIRASAWNASEGSLPSYKFLQEQNRRLAKLANSRLRALEKSGYDMFAYDRAYTYLHNLGQRRFSTKLPDQSDYKGMVSQLSELVTFINAKTSTVAGARKALNDKLDKISEFTGKEYTEEQKFRLGRLLGTDTVSTLLREVRGDSGEVIDVLEEISMNEANIENISSIIDKHLAGYNPFGDNSDYMSYDEMMDELRRLNTGDEDML